MKSDNIERVHWPGSPPVRDLVQALGEIDRMKHEIAQMQPAKPKPNRDGAGPIPNPR
jgi:hypothetical protein